MLNCKLPRLLAVILLLCVLQKTPASAQGYGGHRSIIGRTLGDLRRAGRFAHGGREHERIENARRHLSDFDRALSHGYYDRGRFDEAIDDLHNVVRNNYLPPREHDILNDDLQQLRDLRARERRF